MNFSKKLLALFLLFFIPIFGMNSFNYVNNKQNQILTSDQISVSDDYLLGEDNTDLKIESITPLETIYYKYDSSDTIYAKEKFNIKFNIGTLNLEDIYLLELDYYKNDNHDHLISSIGDLEEGDIINPITKEGSLDFEIDYFNIDTTYSYDFALKGKLYGDIPIDSKGPDPENPIYTTVSFETSNPFVETPKGSVSVNSVKSNSLDVKFELINVDWFTIDKNDIKLNLYKKGNSETDDQQIEPIELIQIDNSSYSANLKDLESNTDYYIKGTFNYVKKINDSTQSPVTVDVLSSDFKTLKPWYARTGGIIVITTILILLLLSITAIMIWYFAFYRVKVKKKQLRKDLNF